MADKLKMLGVNLAVRLDMVFGGLFGVLQGARVMAMCQMRVVACSFVKALVVMTGGFAMMTSSVLVVLRCLPVMVRCFFRHREFLSSCRRGCGTRGLCAAQGAAWVTSLRMEDEKKRHRWRTFSARNGPTSISVESGPEPAWPPTAAPGRDRRETCD